MSLLRFMLHGAASTSYVCSAAGGRFGVVCREGEGPQIEGEARGAGRPGAEGESRRADC